MSRVPFAAKSLAGILVIALAFAYGFGFVGSRSLAGETEHDSRTSSAPDVQQLLNELTTLGARLPPAPKLEGSGGVPLMEHLEILQGISPAAFRWLVGNEEDSQRDLLIFNHFARDPELRDQQKSLGAYRARLKSDSGPHAKQRDLPRNPLVAPIAPVQYALQEKWEALLRDKKPERWDGLKKDGGQPIYRRDICGLVALDLQEAAAKAGGQALIVRASASSETRETDLGSLKVLSRSSRGGAPVWTNYSHGFHVATFLSDGKGAWGVVDPLTFGDTRPRSVSEWLPRLKDWQKLDYELIPRDAPGSDSAKKGSGLSDYFRMIREGLTPSTSRGAPSRTDVPVSNRAE